MLARLALLFILVPAVELALLAYIKDLTGSLALTFLIVILTGVVGAWLARREGLRCWRSVQQEISQGRLPADSLLDGLLILVAGALLVTPGVLTDCVGFALLLPPLRRPIKGYLTRRFKDRITFSTAAGRPSGFAGDDDVIDVESHSTDTDSPSD